jgi:hypothetical protein
MLGQRWATAAVGKIDARLAKAQAAGLLEEFNREYRVRRVAAEARGARFMPYAIARSRLQRALGKVAAGEPAAIMREVFAPRWPRALPAAPVARQTGEGCPMSAYRIQ